MRRRVAVIVVGAEVVTLVGCLIVDGGVIVRRRCGLIEGICLIDLLAWLRWARFDRYIFKPKPVELFPERVQARECMVSWCFFHEPALIAEVRQKVEIAHGLEIRAQASI